MRVAKTSFDLCEGKEAHIVDTYARALFDTGKTAEALKFQKQAVALCQDDNLRPELEETLKRYEKTAQERGGNSFTRFWTHTVGDRLKKRLSGEDD